MVKTFQEENNEILTYILNEKFFNNFREDRLEFQRREGLYIEFYVTSVCNQKCEYCYLQRYGEELYPKEIRNISTILNNERILLNYFIEKNYFIDEIDFFSGEIWGMEFGNKVLDILLEALDNGLHLIKIMIPSNMSFLMNENTKKIIQKYINEFKKRKVRLMFSASVDGKIVENKTRSYKKEEFNKQKSSNEFYEILFEFCKKNEYGFHPMVSAYGIEKWKENFLWWMKQLKKYHFPLSHSIMMLEVRNDDWTEDKIKLLLELVDYMINYMIKYEYKGDLKKFIQYIFDIDPIFGPRNYCNLDLLLQGKNPSCTISRALCLRLGDLTIAPCHRLSYDKYNYGKIIIENEKILGFQANNIQLANKILFGSTKTEHRCDVCEYNSLCMRGCLGAQYESNNDPLIVCDSVCKMFKSKINFLIYKYNKIGVFKILQTDEDFNKSPLIETQLLEINKIFKGDNYRQWMEKMNLIN